MRRNGPFLGTSERPNGVEVWDNGDAKREPDRANESDSLATNLVQQKGA